MIKFKSKLIDLDSKAVLSSLEAPISITFGFQS